MVIALTIVLALGLSVGIASAWNPPAGADWSVTTSGFGYGNFAVGGTVFGSSPGYPGPSFTTTGYMVEAGVSIVAGLKNPGIFNLVSFGFADNAQTRLIPWDPYKPCAPATYAKTIEGFQRLQQTDLVCGESYVTTEMYSSFGLTGYPTFQMLQKVGDTPRPFPPMVADDQTGQVIAAHGDGPGYASMYTMQSADGGIPVVYGLLGADLAGGYWDFAGWQVVDYDPDGGDLSGDVDLWGTW